MHTLDRGTRPTAPIVLSDDQLFDFVRDEFRANMDRGLRAIDNAMTWCVDRNQQERVALLILLLIGHFREAFQSIEDQTAD